MRTRVCPKAAAEDKKNILVLVQFYFMITDQLMIFDSFYFFVALAKKHSKQSITGHFYILSMLGSSSKIMQYETFKYETLWILSKLRAMKKICYETLDYETLLSTKPILFCFIFKKRPKSVSLTAEKRVQPISINFQSILRKMKKSL